MNHQVTANKGDLPLAAKDDGAPVTSICPQPREKERYLISHLWGLFFLSQAIFRSYAASRWRG
jgi:hypothetical protein